MIHTVIFDTVFGLFTQFKLDLAHNSETSAANMATPAPRNSVRRGVATASPGNVRSPTANSATQEQATPASAIAVFTPVSVVTPTNNNGVSVSSEITTAYMNQMRAQNCSVTEMALVEALKKFVRTNLFRRVKFITSSDDLLWEGSIQKWIYWKLNFAKECGMKDFWQKHGDVVRTALNKKRGNAGNEVKSSFTSKCFGVIITGVPIATTNMVLFN